MPCQSTAHLQAAAGTGVKQHEANAPVAAVSTMTQTHQQRPHPQQRQRQSKGAVEQQQQAAHLRADLRLSCICGQGRPLARRLSRVASAAARIRACRSGRMAGPGEAQQHWPAHKHICSSNMRPGDLAPASLRPADVRT